MERLLLAAVLALSTVYLLPAQGLAEDDAGGTVEILVVRARTGEAVRGAKVRARAETSAGISEWPRTTDEQGRATFDSLRVKAIDLRVSAEGFVAVQKDGVKITPDPTTLRIELAAGVPFDGVVQDASGNPIPQARVDVQAGGVFKNQREAKPNHAAYALASTDNDGRFHVPGIPKGAIATVVVRARGFAQGRVAVRAAGGRVVPQPLTIRLPAGGRVRGRVFDSSRKLVRGASVYVIEDGIESLKKDPRTASPGDADPQTFLDKKTTDRKGRFAIDGLTLGRSYLACAYADGFDRSPWVGPFSVSKAGQKVTVALTLREASTGR